MKRILNSRIQFKMLFLFALAFMPFASFARGEHWVKKQPPPPPVSTLTNEARYIEWKWR
jgi:hypothetical protein